MKCEDCGARLDGEISLRKKYQEANDYIIDLEEENDKLRKIVSQYDKDEKKYIVRLTLEHCRILTDLIDSRQLEIKDSVERYLAPESTPIRKHPNGRNNFLESCKLDELSLILE